MVEKWQLKVACVTCAQTRGQSWVACGMCTDIMTVLEAACIQNQGARETSPHRGDIVHNPLFCVLSSIETLI